MIASIALDPPDPEVSPAALAAIDEADWAVLGPGSWFTSVIPHLLVPQLREALVATDARLIVVLNLAEQQGETDGFGPADHLAVLVRARARPPRAHRARRPRERRRRRGGAPCRWPAPSERGW